MGKTINDVLDNWEHEIDGTPKHWKKSPERIATDKKYLELLLADILEFLPETEHEDYCDLKQKWSNLEDVVCSCDKDPADRYKERVVDCVSNYFKRGVTFHD